MSSSTWHFLIPSALVLLSSLLLLACLLPIETTNLLPKLILRPPLPFASTLLLSWVLSLTLPTLLLTLVPLALPSSSMTYYLLYCPRWAIHVKISTHLPYDHPDRRRPREKGSPFFTLPPPSHQTYALLPSSSSSGQSSGPSPVLVVTGASSGFFDRLENMVGSIHTWADPGQNIHIYDLGFTPPQASSISCWRNVLLLPFPFKSYPPHVADITNYAFKALAIQLSLESSADRHKAVLWIDSGLELRAPTFTLFQELSLRGHVSALQEDLIGDEMYTKSEEMARWFGMGMDREATQPSVLKEKSFGLLGWEWKGKRWGEGEVERWQFCAGGLQGFVRGSEAHHLILEPVVRCSLHGACIAPQGSSRANHNFDQTAFTLAIRASNFSCLPRETHMMWSVKKASIDPRGLSTPIEVISRGHRMPKPYSRLVRHEDGGLGCLVVDGNSSSRGVFITKIESLNRHSLWFKITRVYLQPVGDGMVMAWSCLGFHFWVLFIFWAQIAWLKILGLRSFISNFRPATKRTQQQLQGEGFWGAVSIGSLLILIFQAMLFQLCRGLR